MIIGAMPFCCQVADVLQLDKVQAIALRAQQVLRDEPNILTLSSLAASPIVVRHNKGGYTSKQC